MHLTIKELETGKHLVLLNGRRIVDPIEANEEEGWVDIIDIAALAPVSLEEDDAATVEDDDLSTTPWEQIPFKRLRGRVEIKQLG